MLRVASDLTAAVLEQALTGEATRQRVTADNLANVDTPGYRPRQVMFEDELRAALRDSDEGVTTARVAAVQPRSVTADGLPLRRDGNAVDVEREVVRLAESELHYSALIKLLARKFSLLKSVATEGNKT